VEETRRAQHGRIGNVSPSLLVVVSGLPATGKTTLSTILAERIGAVALSRDLARQQIVTRLPRVDRVFTRITGRHRRGLQERAGHRLLMAVAGELAAGKPVIVEAVADRAIRSQLAALAAQHQARLYSIEVVCTDATELSRRLHRRPGNWQRILARTSKSYEPQPQALVVDSSITPGAMADQAMQFINQDHQDEP
jgi:predicted kinase